MSYDASNIISITTRISPQGLANANFGLAMLFAPEAELSGGFLINTYRTYSDLTELEVDFANTTETYKAAAVYFQMLPTPQSLMVFARSNVTDADTVLTTLGIAANLVWWYWTLFTVDVYTDEPNIDGIADWMDANIRYMMNCSTAADIRDPGDATDIASVLTASGQRHISTFSHATDNYAGHALIPWFSTVNYSNPNSTITGEFKKLPGVAAESLPGIEYDAMKLATKKAVFYTVVDLQGSTDSGRVINSWSHSAFGEYIDDVINLDAFVNALRVALFDAAANVPTKLAQIPTGQQVLITAAENIGREYISNGYLGPRIWTNPDTGFDEEVTGFQMLSNAADILTLSDSDRNDRKSAPIQVRLFRAGAIHAVDVTVDVF